MIILLLVPTAAKTSPKILDDISQALNTIDKIFEREMLITILPTTFFEMFCKIILNSKVIVKKYHRSRRQFLDELLSIDGLTCCLNVIHRNHMVILCIIFGYTGKLDKLGHYSPTKPVRLKR